MERKSKGLPDSRRVNINDPSEVRSWQRKFGCTEEELRAAIAAVGENVRDVEPLLHVGELPNVLPAH